MEKVMYNGYKNVEFPVYKYEVENPKAIVIIAHGVAENATRYEYVAKYLNDNNVSVYALDHIGHGPDLDEQKLGHWVKGDFDGCLYNIYLINKELRTKHPKTSMFLLGHSMGSFMAQKYQLLYPNTFQGMILSGPAKADLLFKMGSFVASFIYMFSKKTKRIKTMDKLAFGSFDKQFKPNKTTCDWLCKDEEICKWYQDTPYTGFIGTASFYKEFYRNISKIPSRKYKRIYDKDYPLLFLGGKDDMVSARGKKFKKLVKFYKKQSNKVSSYLFENLRHEVFNEIEKDEVLKILSDWIGENSNV